MIWIGTSGFQYAEWKGSFYPATISAKKMLPFYASHFPTTEINYSFKRIPTVKALANWNSLTPAQFKFSFKAPREITHLRQLKGCVDILARFSGVLKTIEAKLGVILFQLSPAFKKDLPLLKDFLGELPAELNCAFEFRHTSWFEDETFTALKSRNAALCIAESDEFNTPIVFTANFGYFRLRRVDYGTKDISAWAKIVRENRGHFADIYTYFKHEETGVGPRFADQLMAELNVE